MMTTTRLGKLFLHVFLLPGRHVGARYLRDASSFGHVPFCGWMQTVWLQLVDGFRCLYGWAFSNSVAKLTFQENNSSDKTCLQYPAASCKFARACRASTLLASSDFCGQPLQALDFWKSENRTCHLWDDTQELFWKLSQSQPITQSFTFPEQQPGYELRARTLGSWILVGRSKINKKCCVDFGALTSNFYCGIPPNHHLLKMAWLFKTVSGSLMMVMLGNPHCSKNQIGVEFIWLTFLVSSLLHTQVWPTPLHHILVSDL